ncbi:MAG: right-handed parallel beta-helix repeat-containing protein [Leptospirales bacterium]
MKITIYATFAFLPFLMTLAPSGKIISINPDQTEQINSIIKKAEAGDTIHFTAGKYITKTSISIRNKKNLKIVGEDGTEFILNDMHDVVFFIYESDNISVKNIKARHAIPRQPGGKCSGGVIAVFYSHDIEIINSELNGSGTLGVDIGYSSNVRIVGSYLHHNTVAGVALRGIIDGIIIENNHIVNNPKAIDTDLTKEQLEKYVVMRNNNFK